MPRHPGNFGELAVQRIIFDGTFHRQLFAHEAGAVDHLDGFLRGETGNHEFAAARVTRHQMRLDEAECETEVGTDEALVDPGGSAGARRAEVAVACRIARVVVFHAIGGGDFFADDFADFVGGGGAMQSGGDQDDNARAFDACGFEAAENRGRTMRLGAGRVMSQTEMAAEVLSRARSMREGEEMGRSRACSMAAV